MHKVKLVSLDRPDISYKIYVHPYLVTDDGDSEHEKLVWMDGASIKEEIDGKPTDLIEISAEVLNDLCGGNNYQVTRIILCLSRFRAKDDVHASRNPLGVYVRSYNERTRQFKHDRYKLLDYHVPKWYLELLGKYAEQEEKVKQLEYALYYQPGGTGYQEAKEDFKQRCIGEN